MAKLFVFRHAQTTDNITRTFSGNRDPELTEHGIEEAKKVRDKLKKENVTKAYCAPNKRTKHTLEIALEGHTGYELIADPRIRERDYGNLTGKNKDEIAKNFPKEWPGWHRGYDSPPPHGESIKEVEVRVMDFLNEVLQNIWQNDVIFICGSANSLRPIRGHFENMTHMQEASYEYEPGQVYSYKV
jgi:2,3-bisphosphoglycerate-dependent phosphoglycerate mutase